MIKASVEVPTNYFKFIEQRLEKASGEVLPMAARLACQKLAVATFPTGTSGKTFETLKKAIYKDMNNAYVTSDHTKPNDDGSYLLRHRTTSKGRVPEGTKRKGISRANYEDLKKKFEKHAGMAKAGWLQAAEELGKTRVPAWLRKPTDLATVQKAGPSIIVTNKTKYADNLLTDSQIRNSMVNAINGLLKLAERKVAK